MYKINIPYNRTTDAIRWAAVAIGPKFNVQHNFPADMYTFIFSDEQDAAHFALKWA